jgi:hypothetical protein
LTIGQLPFGSKRPSAQLYLVIRLMLQMTPMYWRDYWSADAAASWITTHRFRLTWSAVDEVNCLVALLGLAARMSWDCSASGWSWKLLEMRNPGLRRPFSPTIRGVTSHSPTLYNVPSANSGRSEITPTIFAGEGADNGWQQSPKPYTAKTADSTNNGS